MVLVMVSLLGTDLTDFTLGFWVLEQPKYSISDYSHIWFFEAAPGVLMALFIGSLIDRWDKKRIIIYGQLVAGIGSVTLMLLHYFGNLEAWHIMVVTGIGSIASTFVFTAFFISTTALVPKSKLLKAQGMTSGMFAVISMVVPAMAPVLYEAIGLNMVFLIDIVTFSISIIAFLLINFVVVEKSKEEFSLKNDWIIVKRFIKSKKGLIQLITFFFFIEFLTGFVDVLFAPLILDFSGKYELGIVTTVVGFGTLIGAIVMGSRNKISKPVRLIMTINIVVGIILSCLWIRVDLYVIGTLGMFVMMIFAMSEVLNDVFYQTVVPTKFLGRIAGFQEMLIGGAAPLSYLISGPLVKYLEKPTNNFFSELLSYFPGSTTTVAIMIVFAFSGISLIGVSLYFRKHKGVKNLDKLYELEQRKENDNNEEKEEGNELIIKKKESQGINEVKERTESEKDLASIEL